MKRTIIAGYAGSNTDDSKIKIEGYPPMPEAEALAFLVRAEAKARLDREATERRRRPITLDDEDENDHTTVEKAPKGGWRRVPLKTG